MAYLSASFAQLGRCSPIIVPGTLVRIGLYGPRISSGASGLRSHMSMVLGPPSRNRKMQAFAFAGVSAAAVACQWSNCGRLRPASIPVAPTRRACRRVIPSQRRAPFRPKGMIITAPHSDNPSNVDSTPARPRDAIRYRFVSVVVDELFQVQKRPQRVLD